MVNKFKTFYIYLIGIAVAIIACIGISPDVVAANTKEMVVVIDAGHGGKDHGAIDNNAREKDINLAVALKLGELIKKKLKDTKVIYTRSDDIFVTLQGRADIANKAKADLFISIHTNSVDAKNKNRKTVAGSSVYTQGGHKDEANLEVAKRENSVIELENGYEQKYSGFDPNKVESYIIFEMAQKNNLNQSFRFAKDIQDNLVKIAGRKDRGVHQAGFWVLWATSMPSVLVELDFICNPESAKYMTSSHGVDKLAEGIFEAVKNYEAGFRQKHRKLAENGRDRKETDRKSAKETDSNWASEVNSDAVSFFDVADPVEAEYATVGTSRAVVTRIPESEGKDLSHSNLSTTRNQKRARNATEGRRRRSGDARTRSASRDLSVGHIEVRDELAYEPEYTSYEEETTPVDSDLTADAGTSGGKDKKSKKDKRDKKEKKEKEKSKKINSSNDRRQTVDKNSKNEPKKDPKLQKGSREWVAEVNKIANREKNDVVKKGTYSSASTSREEKHAGGRKSLRSKNQK